MSIKSYHSGYIGEALSERKADAEVATEAHQKINERLDDVAEATQDIACQLERVDETTSDISRRVDEMDSRMEELGETVVMLHSDDADVDQDVLRERAGVDGLPGDVRQRGD